MARQKSRRVRDAILMLTLAGIVGPLSFTEATVAAAEPGPNPYSDVVVTKAFDGTGHGTMDATYVNTKNGFVPGDDTPEDGVVSSNDVVGYDVSLFIRAGLPRTVSVRMSGSEFLSWADGLNEFCRPVAGISAKVMGDTCEFTISQGATAQLNRQIRMTAQDTGGRAVDEQRLQVEVGISGQSPYATVTSEPVTVVSAPRADLTIRGGSAPFFDAANYNPVIPTFDWTSTAGAGAFVIEARPLRPINFSATKGVAISAEWSAALDVTDFPDGTTWTLDGNPVEAKSGQIYLTSSGNRVLKFVMPGGVWPELGEDESATFSVGMEVSDTSFATEDYLNNGDGWQPGTRQSRDKSTFDRDLGAVSGFFYKNNDYSAIQVVRPAPAEGSIFTKYLEVPGDPSATVFEPGNMYWANSVMTNMSTASQLAQRAPGSEFIANLVINADDLAHAGIAVMADVWDAREAFATGRVAVLNGPDAVDPSLYTVQWSAEAPNHDTASDPNDTGGWITADGPVPGANAVRVVFNDGVIAPETGSWTVKIPMQSVSDRSAYKDPLITDTHFGRVDNLIGGVSAGFIAVFPALPTIAVTQAVDKDEINPGDVLTYTVSPSVSNPPTLTDGFRSVITVELDRCEVEPKNLGSMWNMEVIKGQAGPSGRICGDLESVPTKLVFTPASGDAVSHRSWNAATQTAVLYPVTYSARTTLSVRDVVATTAVHQVNGLGEVVAVSANSKTVLSEQPASAASITALQDRVEIADSMSWEVSLVQAIDNGASSTVIALPRNNDGQFWNGDLDPDDLYPGEKQSDFTGNYTVSSVSLNGEDTSAGVELWFTTASNPSLDATHGTWHKVSEAGTGAVPELSGATALKVVSEASGAAASTALVTVELQPAGNAKDDIYVMWVGDTAVDGDGSGATQPWPAQSRVVAGTISGTTWWDEDNSASIDEDETRIPNVELGLFQVVDRQVEDTPIKVAKTDGAGYYEFAELRSGEYQVHVIARGDHLPETVTSYYGKDIVIENTFTFKGQRYARASMKSTTIALGVEGRQREVDFGFFSPDPLVDVNKRTNSVECEAGVCEVTWSVTVTNLGNSKITSGEIVDTTSSEVYDVEAMLGEFTPGSDIVKIYGHGSVSSRGGYALTGSGDLYGWGAGFNGGGSNAVDSLTAVKVIGLPEGGVQDVVTASGLQTYALTKSGDVYAWGYQDSLSSIGDGSSQPRYSAVKVPGLPDGGVIKVVSAERLGFTTTFALTSNGDVYSWGYGGRGANGNGSEESNASPQLVQGLPLGSVTDVTIRMAGGGFATTVDGSVYAWGYGGLGGNGNGTRVDAYTAKPVLGLPEGEIKQLISRNSEETAERDVDGAYVLTGSGTVYAWGFGTESTAVQVEGLPAGQVASITASVKRDGGSAITIDGDLYEWGTPRTGQGIVAERIEGLPAGQVTAVMYDHVLTAAGEVYRLMQSSNSAYLIPGLEGEVVSEVIARSSDYSAYALTENGDVYAWGDAFDGANGGGHQISTGAASLVLGLPEGAVTQLAAQAYGSYALTSTGDVYSWGRGQYGGNGNGSQDSNLSAEPVRGLPAPRLLASSALTASRAEHHGGLTERHYAFPSIPAGEQLTMVIRGKVNQAVAGQTVVNQAWFTSPSTPIAGLLPDGQVRPNPPEDPGAGYDPEGLAGNATCDTDANGQNHENPDSCDQVAVLIPAVDPGREPGAVTGIAWLDVNRDGIVADSEPMLPGIEAYLYSAEGALRGTSVTGADGSFKFTNVPAGEGYYVVFGVAASTPTADQLELFGLETGSYGITTEGERSATTSWTNRESSSAGSFDVAAGGTEKWVNVGLVLEGASIEVVKSSDAGDPASLTVDADGNTAGTIVNISFTNTGSEALTGFSWADTTIEGPELTGLECGADAENLVLLPGETVTCAGVLPSMSIEDPTHADRFTVNAVGAVTKTPVVGSDGWAAVADGQTSWSLSKESNPASGGYVGAGSEITYTLTATNTGDLTMRAVQAIDDMSGVLAHAEMIGGLPAGLHRTGTTLIWTIDELAPGMSTSVQYTVKVHADAWDQTLTNSVTTSADVEPDTCTDSDPCKTEHHTPPWPGALPLPVLGNLAFLAFTGVGLLVLAAGTSLMVRRKRNVSEA